MLLWVLFGVLVPLVGGMGTLLLPARQQRIAGWITTGALAISAATLTWVFAAVWPPGTTEAAEITWLPLPAGRSLTVGLWLDRTAALMGLLVAWVSLAVTLFSVWYLHKEGHQRRYFAALSLFVGAMQGLVFSSSLLSLFLFWEAVGLCSYLLIGFYASKPSAARAASQAFWVNRVADAALLAGIFFWYDYAGSFSLAAGLASEEGRDSISLVGGLLLVVGAMGKSAQIPFHGWLPDAMTGPSPVSALIHAATMVAAGIYLLIRVSAVLPSEMLGVLQILGGSTALLGSVQALREWDVKRVLAYSTIAQLGYMTAAVGLGAPHLALFHLLTHAAFKAALFLCAGSVLQNLYWAHTGHSFSHAPGDLRQLGGLGRRLPVTATVAGVALAALGGLPFTAGFLSKEAILLRALQQSPILGAVLGLAGLLTLAYGARWWMLLFAGSPRYPEKLSSSLAPVHSWLQRMPLLGLGLASLPVLYFPLQELGQLAPTSADTTHNGYLPIALIPTTVVFAGLSVAYYSRRIRSTDWPLSDTGNSNFGAATLYRWIGWGVWNGTARVALFLDGQLLDRTVETVARVVGRFRPLYRDISLARLSYFLDQRIWDRWMDGIAIRILQAGSGLQRLQSGRLQQLLLYTILGIATMVVLLLGFF